MEFYISKVSNDKFYKFESFNTIDSVMKKYHRVIIEKNFFYKENPKEIRQNWYGEISLQDALRCSNCKYNIIIYDDYIE